MTSLNKPSKDDRHETWKEMVAKAKSSWTWELANAGSNLQLNLYDLRKKHGYTQRQLGKLMGVAQPHIVRHEAWGYMPSMDSLAKYAHVYGVSIAELLAEPPRPNPETLWQWSDKDQEYVEIGTVKTTSTASTVSAAVCFEGMQQLGGIS